jgi:hypothetical protein
MKIASFTMLMVMLSSGGLVEGATLTFDDLAPVGTNTQVPNGYAGLFWGDFYVANGAYATSVSGGSYAIGTVSQPNMIYNGGGGVADIYCGGGCTNFSFNSTYITAAFDDPLFVLVEGLIGGINGTVVDSTTVIAHTSVPSFFYFNYLGVDAVRFTSRGGPSQFVLDNVTIAPEPGTFILLSSGFIAFIVLVRKTKTRRFVLDSKPPLRPAPFTHFEQYQKASRSPANAQ